MVVKGGEIKEAIPKEGTASKQVLGAQWLPMDNWDNSLQASENITL